MKNIQAALQNVGYKRNYEFFSFGDVYQKVVDGRFLTVVVTGPQRITDSIHLKKIRSLLAQDPTFMTPSEDNVFIIVDEINSREIAGMKRVPNTILTSRERNTLYSYGVSGQFQDIPSALKEQRVTENAWATAAKNVVKDYGCNYVYPAINALVIVICTYLYVSGVSKNSYAAIPQEVLRNNEYYRLFTSMFLHMNLGHLIGNMLALVFVGRSFESRYGHATYALTYIIGGLYASLFSVHFYNTTISSEIIIVGASGAIFALIGAEFVGAIFFKDKSNALRVLVYATVCLLCGFMTKDTANAAHMAGMAFGGLTMLVIQLVRRIATNTQYTAASSVLRKHGKSAPI